MTDQQTDWWILNEFAYDTFDEAQAEHCDITTLLDADAGEIIHVIRADTAIPRADADAMVAAVVDACAEVLEECGIDGSAFAQTFEEYRHGRAAFERAVQEAVEAERERCARISEALGDIGLTAAHEQYEEGHADACDRIAAAIRDSQEPSE